MRSGILFIMIFAVPSVHSLVATSSSKGGLKDNLGFLVPLFEKHHPTVVGLPCSQKFVMEGYIDSRDGDPLGPWNSEFFSSEASSFDISEELAGNLAGAFRFSSPRLRLIGEGSHRRLEITLEWKPEPDAMPWLLAHTCELVIVEELPIGVFADPYELQRFVQRRAFLDAGVFGDKNLELPSALSNRSIVELHLSIESGISSDLVVELPLHARYPPLGSGDIGFSEVEITTPHLSMRCRSEGAQKVPCSWMLVEISTGSSRSSVHWSVPRGNDEHREVVSTVTSASALVSALLIIYSAMKYPTRQYV